MNHVDRAGGVGLLKRVFLLHAAVGLWPLALAAAGPAPVPFRVVAPVPDAAEILLPDAVHIDGWLGRRIDANVTNRLLQVDTVPLLAGFHKRPGEMAWIGEHVGGLDNQIIAPGDEVGRGEGEVRCRERLGGLLRYYYWDAA